MSGTSIPAFKAALVSRLQADAAIGAATPPVQVTYGFLGMGQAGLLRELVWVGDSRAEDASGGGAPYAGGGQRAAVLGRRRREERYVVEVTIIVTTGGLNTQQSCTERAFAICHAVEANLQSWGAGTDDYNYASVSAASGGQFTWAQTASIEHQEGRLDSGDLVCGIRIEITCAASIWGP